MVTRRWRHRIPVRVRHYWKLLATCAVVMAGLVALAGNVRITPLVTSTAHGKSDEVIVNIGGSIDLFDSTVAHTMTLSYDEADYQRMFDEYLATGDKGYVRVDVSIDGTLIRDVGIRLKGNSTLSRVTHEGKTVSLRDGLGGGLPDGGLPGAPPGGQQPGGQNGGVRPGGGGFGAGGGLDSSRPEELPWLMSFDEFVQGRRYQGKSEIAVRVAGMGGGSTVMNEAVSLEVMHTAGLPSQRYAYTSFQINGRPTKARLLVEHPDEDFADTLGNGVLYKALATSQFTYQGEDPNEYEDDFKQVNNKGDYDLKPVIDLLKWVGEASAADFDAHLGDHVDLSSLASYTALQNLLLNGDDMSGPGRNYYLWYDLDTNRFKVISWDHNLTFSGNAALGPEETASIGGGGRGGFPPPDGMQLPEGMQLPDGLTPPQGGIGPGGGGPRGMGNSLKERFLASEAFKSLYQQAYRDLYGKIYASGAAAQAVERINSTINSVEGNDAATTTSDAGRLRATIDQRTTALAEKISG